MRDIYSSYPVLLQFYYWGFVITAQIIALCLLRLFCYLCSLITCCPNSISTIEVYSFQPKVQELNKCIYWKQQYFCCMWFYLFLHIYKTTVGYQQQYIKSMAPTKYFGYMSIIFFFCTNDDKDEFQVLVFALKLRTIPLYMDSYEDIKSKLQDNSI